jgi:transcriptional regulator NrdR family protein
MIKETTSAINTDGIKCPECDSLENKVFDKRNHINQIIRRRKCSNGHRFSTIETYAERDGNKLKLKQIDKKVEEPHKIDYKQLAIGLNNIEKAKKSREWEKQKRNI